mgnify:CR=1 FL=1
MSGRRARLGRVWCFFRLQRAEFFFCINKNSSWPACVPLLLSIINDVIFHGMIIKAHNMKAMTKNLYFCRNARASITFKPSESLKVIILTGILLLSSILNCSEQDMLIRLILPQIYLIPQITYPEQLQIWHSLSSNNKIDRSTCPPLTKSKGPGKKLLIRNKVPWAAGWPSSNIMNSLCWLSISFTNNNFNQK